MKKMHLTTVAGIAVVAALAGCASRQGASEAPAPAAAAEKPARPIPPDSPLAKIREGMSTQDVMNILGAPTSQSNYASGKAWIPYYYGNDARRSAYFYKGLGSVVFATGNVFGGGGGGAVVSVEYDPNETGVAR